METTTAAAAPARKAAPRKTGKTKAKAAPRKTGSRVALKVLAAELEVDPKALRRKLRRVEFGNHDRRDRWTFTEAQAAKVRELYKAN